MNSGHIAVNSGHLPVSSGHLVVSRGHLAVTSGNLAVSSGHMAVSSGHLAVGARGSHAGQTLPFGDFTYLQGLCLPQKCPLGTPWKYLSRKI